MSVPPFIHQITLPAGSTQNEGGKTPVIVHLHGTGGTETDLLPIVQRIAPTAVAVGVRGRSLSEGSPRWFRRHTMTTFDQKDIHAEVQAFTEFLTDLYATNQFNVSQTTFLGYSNGANFIAALMLLRPGAVRQAILLRPMLVLEDPPHVDLAGTHALIVTGEQDPYRLFVEPLESLLLQNGVSVETHTIAAGHELARPDLTLSEAWLKAIRSREQAIQG